jgi:hypothetical protein
LASLRPCAELLPSRPKRRTWPKSAAGAGGCAAAGALILLVAACSVPGGTSDDAPDNDADDTSRIRPSGRLPDEGMSFELQATFTYVHAFVVARRVEFTLKAETERIRDGLTVEDVLESILNANAIKKVVRSRSRDRSRRREPLYVIESPTFTGLWLYTKGTIRRKAGREVFYVLISSKLST